MKGVARGQRGGWVRMTGMLRAAAAVALGGACAAGCEYPFEPFEESQEGAFSVFGYLDLKADTQWVRLMPIRQSLLPGPEPIDAVVTLEEVGSGRTVTLRDSTFRFTNPALGGEAYAHNFWTTERLEPGGTYRLRAERSDGAATTAEVVMPLDLEFTFRSTGADNALLHVRAEHILAIEVSFAMSDSGLRIPALVLPQLPALDPEVPNLHNLFVDGSELILPRPLADMRRQEIRLAVARSDWPYHPDLPDLDVLLPGTMPSNVENGFGFLGAVAVWTVPFHRCEVVSPTEVGQDCIIEFSRESASLSGRVLRAPCGEPHTFGEVRLREMTDGEQGILRTWKTGWEGEYRFEGIAPGAHLFLDLGPGTQELPLPRLSAAERYTMEDLFVLDEC